MDKNSNTNTFGIRYMNHVANTEGYVGAAVITIISRPTVLKKRHLYPATNQLQSREAELDTLKHYNTKTNKLYMLQTAPP